MKQSALIPILVLTAGGAFGLGWIVKPGATGENGNLVGGSKSTSSSSRLARPAGSGNSKSNSADRVEDFLANYTSGGTISPEDMTAAIEQMRKEMHAMRAEMEGLKAEMEDMQKDLEELKSLKQ